MLGGHFSITMLGRNSSLIRVEPPESVHTAVRPWKSFVRQLQPDVISPSFPGELRLSASCPEVSIDFEEPFAHVYEQMEAADIAAFANLMPGRDDPSFFFVRGLDAVRAFDRGLRAVTASK